MLIYIMHSDRFFTFRLPKVVSGNFVLFDYDEKDIKRSLVNVYSYNNTSWFIKSNEDIQIMYNGQNVDNIELKEYNFYQLNVYKTENVFLYVCPACESGYITKTVINNCSLTVGNVSNVDIIFKYQGISDKQLELTFNNGIWSFKNLAPNIPIYVNKRRKVSGTLANLDFLFIMGLKIVICGKTLFIKAPGDNVYSYDQKVTNEIPVIAVPDKEVHNEIYKDFYEANEYFYKSPIFRKKINTLHLTITSPESKDRSNEGSLLMQVVPSALMSLTTLISAFYTVRNYHSGKTDREQLVTSVVMCVVMLVATIVWPFVERLASNIRRFIENRRRVFVYTRYLKKKRTLLEETRAEQKMALEFNNVSLDECSKIITNRTAALFSKNVDQDDFLSIRLGKGQVLLDCEISYEKPDFIQYKDKLLDQVDKMLEEYKYIDDAPFSFSLAKEKSLALINSNKDFAKYLDAILLQILAFHDYSSLKIVAFTSDSSSELNKIKNLNHCWDNEREVRFFATNILEAENLSAHLIRIFNQRIESLKNNDNNTKKVKTPHYLIITDSIVVYRNLKIIENVLESNVDVGFSIMMFGSKITEIPDGCDNFIEYTDKEANLFKAEMDENNIHKFIPEFISDNIDFNYYVKLIGNIPINTDVDTQALLPERLGFLEMYGVGNIEQLNILNRWKNSNVITTLSAPIGVDATGNIISLDLHETKHGPHGLIAGMTGSGKSEFIITYILSLAINYSPKEVQFVLIDYKGGGLAGAFENRRTGIKLPHLVGTITNLDKSEMSRTLVSINSELQRRQRMFNKAKEQLDTGSIDIYKYQKLHREGLIEEPLSHLFIICDEFAELKAQQPDFMDELVSTARIGRSLGIHLILATQKPSGVVDEQIWSNSKFKVCCKVQTNDDSVEMIRRPDAAFLKEAGRFFLQVGYDEYFVEGQSAYSGVAYVPSATLLSKVDNSIAFINNSGDIYKSVDKKDEQLTTKKEDLGEELINILKAIIEIANSQKFVYQQLWLDSLPSTIFYDNLVKKYGVKPALYDINPVIGEYDNPKNQSQNYVSLPLTFGGNTYIVGASGSGKTTLLSTIVYSSIINHNAEEVNFYIIDLGAEKLKKFQKAPQVGDVITINEIDKIKYLFYKLEEEKNNRQKYYSEHGGDFLTEVKNKKCSFPNIAVLIYDLEVFKEQFSDLYDDMFAPFTRNCAKYGITFVATSSSVNTLGFMAENNFPQRIMLNMVDSSDFTVMFENPPSINSNPGRGIIKLDSTYEFQVAVIADEVKEAEMLNYVLSQLDKFLVKKAKPIATVPNQVYLDDLKEYIVSTNNLPLGVNLKTALINYYDFDNRINVVSSSRANDAMNFFQVLITEMLFVKNTNIIVLNTLNDVKLSVPDNVKVYDSGFTKVFPVLEKNIEKYNSLNDSTNSYFIIVIGFENLYKHIAKFNETAESKVLNIDELITKSNGNNNFKFILYDTANMVSELKNGEISNVIDFSNGIWIGKGFTSQSVFDYSISYGDDNIKITNDVITIVKNSEVNYVRYIKHL